MQPLNQVGTFHYSQAQRQRNYRRTVERAGQRPPGTRSFRGITSSDKQIVNDLHAVTQRR
jgi:hypothetical protein